ncbi:hypothetical protein [Pseudalkalibacillus caeni]|nr:hypothetical protein [Pseudalkalibacillus caeni]
MYEYFCPDCGGNEWSYDIEPWKTCPECGMLMEHIELDEEE